jgi:ankyrin repeat protein
MLKRHVKVDVADSNGETPLHWAVRKHNVPSVRLLLAAGADPNVKDKKGRTPVDGCTTYRDDPNRADKETIRKLLAAVPEATKDN